METIGFIGGGNMAEALIKGIIEAEAFAPRAICVSDLRTDRLAELADKYGVRTFESNADVAAAADIIVLSVKPMTIVDAMESIKDHVRSYATIISIVAGKRIANITAVLGDIAVIRVMPNTPALIGQGVSALYANEKAKDTLEKALRICRCVGKSLVVDSEDLIDAVTAVSGSGPAYYFLMMKEMIDTARRLGLPPEAAKTLVLQTAKGAAMLADTADADGETPADLSRKVATPGGTTEAALNVFIEGGFGPLVEKALTAARDRSRELSAP